MIPFVQLSVANQKIYLRLDELFKKLNEIEERDLKTRDYLTRLDRNIMRVH